MEYGIQNTVLVVYSIGTCAVEEISTGNQHIYNIPVLGM